MNKVYLLVNQKILEGLKQGYIPWQKPWSVSNGAQIRPFEGLIGKKLWERVVNNSVRGLVKITIFDHPGDIGTAILAITDRKGRTCFEYPGIAGFDHALREAKKLVKIYRGDL